MHSLCFNADGSKLYSAGWDKTIRVWNYKFRMIDAVINAHSFGVNTINISKDCHQLVSGCKGGAIKIWSIE